MPMDSADPFFTLERGAFVRLSGVDGEPSDWHVNRQMMLSGEDQSGGELLFRLANGQPTVADTRQGFILQRADTRTEWLVVVVEKEDGDARIEKMLLTAGSNDRRKLDPIHVEVESIAKSMDALGAD